MTIQQRMNHVGVLGATSLVGSALLKELKAQAFEPIAFSRQRPLPEGEGVQWCALPGAGAEAESVFGAREISLWISLAPIWVLPQYFAALRASGAKRVVALSSTSRFTKTASSVESEQALARRLIDAEAALV